MDVKTFEAFSMRDALKAVKSHFGNDAVILNTREKKIEGAKGKLYEVTAAKNSQASIAGASRAQDGHHLRDNLVELVEYFKTLERSIKALGDDMARRQDLFRLDAGLHELRTVVYDELSRSKGSLLEGMNPGLSKIFQRLKLMGLDDSEMSKLADFLKALPFEKKADPDQLFQQYQTQAIRWMMKRIKVAPPWNPVMGERAVHVLVGSAGSGKTSAAAKIAHHYKTDHKQRVLLVAFDNKRIAAREQLRVTAKVLGMAYESIERPRDLLEILDRKKDWDLVVVDSAAECPRAKEDLGDLLDFRDVDLPVSFHLTLAMTEKEVQMDRMIRGFSHLGLQSLIFNRLDESWSYGEIFNLSLRWSLPISFFGVGRSVPEDLERASRERVVERIFGL
ncbi:DEAD/DEAH box helicase family protein [Oligoflexus tunisiensis]|uniref:DEAD/DEAH box helicase family protein n=1 Tax=Oligoflexus tunisiensis TaxID=708132 RepID=UPI00114C9F64|nr:DEAD/DEAH box helicase family protein [Oligoflexus tunisiensis]